MNLHFQTPAAFFLLALIPPLVYFLLRHGRPPALRFSSTSVASPLPVSWRRRLAGTPVVLRVLALLLLIVALARPQSGRNPIRNVTEGIAIEMVLDRSGSMSAGMQYRGQSERRFDVVRSVFTDFVLGDGRELGGRPDDLVGIIAFAGYPDTISPLTHSHDALASLLQEMDVIRDSSKDGTAIGDAIALAAARLQTAEEQLGGPGAREKPFRIKSKIMILLTDGEQNAGKRSPAEAAALAREWGIKIYAIGVSSGRGFSDSAAEVLQGVAGPTGGIFRTASDERSLRAVYQEIDRLEKTEIASIRYLNVREYFLPFALAALALLLAELLLSRTVLRRLP